MEKILNVDYGVGLKLDIYLPEGKNFDTIVWFHGGGIEEGDKSYCEGMPEDFTSHGYAFVSVAYSLYPNTKFPKYLSEAALAVAFVKRNIKNYGGSGEVYVSGQSAGAYISLMLCLNGEYLSAEHIDTKSIKGWIIDSAQTTSHFNVIHYELGVDRRTQMINEFAPLYYVNENMRFTKMLLIFYENDMPSRPEQNRLFVSAVKQFMPDADITPLKLKGGHCDGSGKKDPDGRLPYVKEALKWIEN